MRYAWRIYFIGFLVFAAVAGIIWRLFDLTVINRSFLLKQSKARILRKINIPAYRGMITDRLGTPLAISTTAYAAWINPKIFKPTAPQFEKLAEYLNITTKYITHQAIANGEREFVYLKRANPPPVVKNIRKLKISGVFFQREYRRYYPQGTATAHLVGITNIDDQGQEGLELGYNGWLAGVSGKKQVLKDRLGNIIANVAVLKKPQQGHDLQLSIDHRIQYLAYQNLQETVTKYHANSGSVIVLNSHTGEVLAMVNYPSYNPNTRSKEHNGSYRNRAVTDMFEPGSVIKPFTIAYALQSGKYTPETKIDTHHGWMHIGKYLIRDDLDYGIVTLTELLQKSSNIAAAKVLLSLDPQEYLSMLIQLGFGQRTLSGFPGESAGDMPAHDLSKPSEIAALAYGYGIAVTPLQLVQAYAVLANQGIMVPISLVKLNKLPQGRQILQPGVAQMVINMLRAVVRHGGTGTRAQIPGYTVAGKTGTAYIAGVNGYKEHHYMSSFVGVAPASNPQLVVAVVIREPQGKHFGGVVAAPLFAKIMGSSLRLLEIAPDDIGKARLIAN